MHNYVQVGIQDGPYVSVILLWSLVFHLPLIYSWTLETHHLDSKIARC